MGFYDCRCLITGVSLKGANAVLIPLQQAGAAYSPITLAIQGSYNRLGSIDGIDEDINTRLVLQFFLDKLRAGEYVVDQEYLQRHRYYPILTIEHLLGGFERNINDHPTAAVLNGQPVVFALVCRAVWSAITRVASGEPDAADAGVFQHLFHDSPVAEGIYGGNRAAVSGHMRELSAVNDFLVGRGLTWQPAEEPSQHYGEEMQQFLDEARQAFSESPLVLGALDKYEREVEDLLEEEE